MNRPRLAIVLLLAIVGCREEAGSPTEPETMGPRPSVSAATALAFWQVSAGDYHTCGLTTDYRAYCWGDNSFGQLGDGTTTTRFTPVPVAGGLRFRQLSAESFASTCAVTTDNRAYCWGSNSFGNLGDGTTTPRRRPQAVVGGLRFRQVSAETGHTCGATTDDRAYCWGHNNHGQLGDGTRTDRLRPRAVVGTRAYRHVSTGSEHTCALATTGRAYCWGSNRYGQVGDSTSVVRRLQPSPVAGGRSFRQLDAGNLHTCAVTTGGRAYCWGIGTHGQLGVGNTSTSFWPKAVAGGLAFGRVSAGGLHSCGESANRAYCWGDNYFGQLGDGTTTNRLRPVAVAGGLTFSQLSAGGSHTCGKTPAAVGYCWGSNFFGQLGDGTTTRRLRPVSVAGPS